MVNDKSVTMCQRCREGFTITFRRHHCRACGKVRCLLVYKRRGVGGRGGWEGWKGWVGGVDGRGGSGSGGSKVGGRRSLLQ